MNFSYVFETYWKQLNFFPKTKTKGRVELRFGSALSIRFTLCHLYAFETFQTSDLRPAKFVPREHSRPLHVDRIPSIVYESIHCVIRTSDRFVFGSWRRRLPYKVTLRLPADTSKFFWNPWEPHVTCDWQTRPSHIYNLSLFKTDVFKRCRLAKKSNFKPNIKRNFLLVCKTRT